MSVRRGSVRRVSVGLVLTALLTQLALAARADEPTAQLVVAGGSIFAGASGTIGVNESAGIANQQINALAIGGTSVSERRTSVTLGNGADHDRTAIAPGAFSNARGIVQLDQTAGDGNAAINSFALRTRP